MTNQNPADAVREALDALATLEGDIDGDTVCTDTVSQHIAALTARVAELEDEKAAMFLRAKEWAFQCGQAEAKADRLAALAGAAPDESKAREAFTTWFCLNYPGPHTIIHDPNWHAPRVFRQALWAINTHAPAKAREVTDEDVRKAVAAYNWRHYSGVDICCEESMRAALATFAEVADKS